MTSIKILVDADTEQFIGVSILGVGGDEIVNMFAPYMYAKQWYKTFRQAVFAHPRSGSCFRGFSTTFRRCSDAER